MTQILKSLEIINTDYTVFTESQVLTAEQLNSIANYFDDQTRLTRVKLLGVGIAHGLRISVDFGDKVTVTVTKGVGITTEGDLLYFNKDTVFEQFNPKPYDNSHSEYLPFYTDKKVENGMIGNFYELVGTDDPDYSSATELKYFRDKSGKTLRDMAAVMFMESYETSDYLCSGTNCDNPGNKRKNTIKLLLLDNTVANLLKEQIATPHQDFSKLHEIVAARPPFYVSINPLISLTQIYKAALEIIFKNLITELENLKELTSSFADIISLDLVGEWMNVILFQLSPPEIAFQYYYDFLKDVVDTYNQFRDLLFGDTTLCCPDTQSFPKHLLLGNLDPGSNPDKNHTAFYPSPLISRTVGQLDHAKFLVQKLDALIHTFKVPSFDNTDIHITPSLFEDQPLEERAIPYYYQINETYQIYKKWNYRLHQRGMDNYNYSYNASPKPKPGEYQARGGAKDPFGSQIGRFPFFRIEGHLGQDISKVLSTIKTAIKFNNLPFIVHAVKLGESSTKQDLPLFTDFIAQHPGLEHFAGVMRGGTFVMVCDAKDIVVADFMLPYYTTPQEIMVSVKPLNAIVEAGGGSCTFTAEVSGTSDKDVTWSTYLTDKDYNIIRDPSGTPICIPLINNAGVFRLPTVQTPFDIVVMATSKADSNKRGLAYVSIPEVSVEIILPPEVLEGTFKFKAEVNGASDKDVTWSTHIADEKDILKPEDTNLIDHKTGILVPNKQEASTTIYVMATSKADITKKDYACVPMAKFSAPEIPPINLTKPDIYQVLVKTFPAIQEITIRPK